MSNWIKCSDRMPDANEWVMASDGWDHYKAEYDDFLKGWYCAMGHGLSGITHWQELPALPEKE